MSLRGMEQGLAREKRGAVSEAELFGGEEKPQHRGGERGGGLTRHLMCHPPPRA